MTKAGSIEREKGDLGTGTHLGRYRIEDPVGRGGMGVVYRAFDETTNRNVALKLISEGIPPALRERFLAECEAEANIRHEHVMPVYDRGWLTDERPYFVMELLYEPITLTEIMEQVQAGTLGTNHPRLRPWNDVRRALADIVLPICEGVHVANAEYGVQHRDLKPDNVLIDIRTRRPYLIDFGICRDMDEKRDIGKIVGTPRYLSPEQARAQVDDRTDVWGLGALIRYVLTGEPPLDGTSPFTRQEVNDRIEALKRAEEKAHTEGRDAQARGYAGRRAQLEDPELRTQDDLIVDAVQGSYLPLPEGTSSGLAAIIHKAMAPHSEDRYETAGDLARDLRAWIKGGSVRALSEAGRRGAAFDFARRLLNRNVMRGAGALIGLIVGTVVAAGVFAETPPQPDFRLHDADTDLARLAADYAELQAQAAARGDARMDPLGCALEHRHIDTRHQSLTTRVQTQVSEQADPDLRAEVRSKSERLARRLSHAQVSLAGRGGDGWVLHDLFDVAVGKLAAEGGSVEAPPGAYELVGDANAGLLLRFALPGDASVRKHVFEIDARPASVPPGMTWIPAGEVPIDGSTEMFRAVAALLAASELVTNEQYSEWLDDLTPAERNASVPPTGFRRDARDATRWLVAADMANEPVLGVSPRDAQAYAAWRTDTEGLTYTLPRERHWLRMAALNQMGRQGAHLLFPMRTGLPWQVRHRAGEKVPTPRCFEGWSRGESPYGVRQIYSKPGEIVLPDEDAGFLVKGESAMLPLRTALLRSGSIELDAKGHAHGFRLIHVP